MKKRLLAIFLVMVLAFNLAGCSLDSGNSKDNHAAVVDIKTDRTGQEEAKSLGKKAEDKKNPEQNEDGVQAEDNKIKESQPEKAKKEKSVLPAASQESQKQVRLIISCDFGSKVVLDKAVAFEEGNTVMDILKANAQVKTAYGGGFVSGINGMESSKGFSSKDWFYYVNGICAETGAGYKKVGVGDVIWWDYHVWRAGLANTALIGAYPEPFLHGYNGKVRPVKVIFTSSCREIAEKMRENLNLAGVKEVNAEEIKPGLLSSHPSPVIVIGEWEELKEIDYIKNLNQAGAKNGMGFYLAEEGIYLLNYEGKKISLYKEKTAVMGASGEGLGDANPLWLITGTDKESLASLADMLKKPDTIRYMYAAALAEGELIRLPLE